MAILSPVNAEKVGTWLAFGKLDYMNSSKKRMLGGLAGAFVGAIVYWIYLFMRSECIHLEGPKDIFLLPIPGIIVGAALGAVFPKPFFKLADLIVQLFPC